MSKTKLIQKVGDTKIVPISYKLIIVFISMILLSNLATNFIAIKLTQAQVISLSNQIMVHQLKDIYTTASNQHAVAKFSGSESSAVASILSTCKSGFTNPNSLALGIRPDGTLFFVSSANQEFENIDFANSIEKAMSDEDLALLESLRSQGTNEGSLRFINSLGEYFGVYKFSEDWGCYIVRAELKADTQKASIRSFLIIMIVIFGVTIAFVALGLFMFNRILRNVKKITDSLYNMQQNQKMELIDLSTSPNDDISYLGASFNSLSSTISNLLGIFTKFASRDVVEEAYQNGFVNLNGNQKPLTILFSDIRSFTYMTETLGNEITSLLNVHYNQVIKEIHKHNGIIGSIIGDAVLAVYGAVDSDTNKSLEALDTGWDITRVTAELREKMKVRYEDIKKVRDLTESEERIYKAVLIDIGVGIDGGQVFYGKIGSNERMTNTVIGDTVNSASRLEGLTRIYSLPVIVSEYVKEEIEAVTEKYRFFEVDLVQVKGKTKGKRVFLPLEVEVTDQETIAKYEKFEEGLQFYYKGDWNQARKKFKEADNGLAKFFLDRIGVKSAPEDWSGIWTMTTK